MTNGQPSRAANPGSTKETEKYKMTTMFCAMIAFAFALITVYINDYSEKVIKECDEQQKSV